MAKRLVVATLLPLAAAAQASAEASVNPALWPTVENAVPRDPALEARVNALLADMSLEDKVAQIVQVDIANVTPGDLLTHKLGAVLNGGTSGPDGDDKAPPAAWLALADAFYRASVTRGDGRPVIPVFWGTDAVHGNNNVPGATIFPHNIGLGAARDPDLVRRIGAITAIETRTAGQEWTFAPTVAVARDDRWGRTYESYAEEPQIVRELAEAMVEGLQGRAGTAEFLAADRVLASSKHYLADGGTAGRDQGDARIPEQALIDIHLPGYVGALNAGTQVIMVSFSSWNGVKMTAHRGLLTEVLKDRMGFDGLLVGDWNAHGQLPGCTNESCALAINAGLDMFMYSGGNWKQLLENTAAQARSGEIPAERLDDAVRRILRVKLRAGLFEAGAPSARPLAGRFDMLGRPAHRAVAREAVRKSLVLLKNEAVLPLSPRGSILVAGAAADSIPRAAGGWSISWQGDDTTNADFPNGQSIWSGIEEAVGRAGGTARYSADGTYAERPDAAIVVFGEEPYAEILGDRPGLEFSPQDKSHLEIMRRLKADGIPVVAVFLSGRPLWVNAEINASDAFVAAFLPGTEGAGLADVLLAGPEGRIAHDFHGKLSFSWPRRPDQFALNRGDDDYDPLFAFGYGLSYAEPGHVPTLDEARPAGVAMQSAAIFGPGGSPQGWSLTLHGLPGMPSRPVAGASGALFGGQLRVRGVDRRRQEDSRAFTWDGRTPAEARIEAARPVDLGAQAAAGESLIVEFRVDERPAGAVALGMVSSNVERIAVPVTPPVIEAPVGEWRSLALPLACIVTQGLDPTRVTAPFLLASDARLAMTISDVRIGPASNALACPAPPAP